MRQKHQPERWEAVVLAIALAIAGTLCLFDKLGAAMLSSQFSWLALMHASPALLAAVAANLLWADEQVPATVRSANDRPREGAYER